MKIQLDKMTFTLPDDEIEAVMLKEVKKVVLADLRTLAVQVCKERAELLREDIKAKVEVGAQKIIDTIPKDMYLPRPEVVEPLIEGYFDRYIKQHVSTICQNLLYERIKIGAFVDNRLTEIIEQATAAQVKNELALRLYTKGDPLNLAFEQAAQSALSQIA